MLGVDGRLLSTARLLLQPGRLTVDYLAGRRAAHVGPVRIYLACSALLFALLALRPPDPTPPRDEFRMFGIARVSVAIPDSVATHLARSEHPTVFERALLRMRAAVRAGPDRHAELEGRIVNAVPQAFFVMVPAYAAAMWLVATRPRRHYPAHLCYAVHLHAFAFAAFAAALAAQIALQRAADVRSVAAINVLLQALFASASVAVLAYSLLAYRRVYGATWPGTVMRVAGSSAIYLVLLALALAALMVAVLLVG